MTAKPSTHPIELQNMHELDHLRCGTCHIHFRWFECENWSDCNEDRCMDCASQGLDLKDQIHCCPHCHQRNAVWVSSYTELCEKVDGQDRMEDIPSYQCDDCGHRFTQQQCAIHADSDSCCAETCMNDEYVEYKEAIHHCPTCRTHNARWVGHASLYEGETDRDFIHRHLQLLADTNNLRVVRCLDGYHSYHILVITQQNGSKRMLRTHLHDYELGSHGIVEMLFSCHSSTDGRLLIRILVGSLIIENVDVFEGLHLDENDGVFEIEIAPQNLVDIIA